MRFRLSRVAALCVGLASLAGGAAHAQTHKIELKPVAAPQEYWLRTIDRSQRASFATTLTTAERGADKWHEVDTLEKVRQTSKPGEPGYIEVLVVPLGKIIRVDGQKVDAEDKREPNSYRITPQNEMPDTMMLGDIAAGLAPKFPATAVPVGHSWTVQIASTEKFPFPYEVKHTFAGVEELQGEKAAVIRSLGAAINKDKELAVSLRVTSDTFIGLDSGLLLRADSFTEFNVQAVQRFKDGHKIQRRHIHRIVERHVPGAKDTAH